MMRCRSSRSELYSVTEDDDDADADTAYDPLAVGADPVAHSSPVSYGLGATFNITAEMNQEVLAGSAIEVSFGDRYYC